MNITVMNAIRNATMVVVYTATRDVVMTTTNNTTNNATWSIIQESIDEFLWDI